MLNGGDVCWVWRPGLYSSGMIARGVVVSCDANLCRVLLRGSDVPVVYLACEVFPTRRALCEHYRKVFE